MTSFPSSRFCAFKFRVILRYSDWNPSGPGAVPAVRLRIALAIWSLVILVTIGVPIPKYSDSGPTRCVVRQADFKHSGNQHGVATRTPPAPGRPPPATRTRLRSSTRHGSVHISLLLYIFMGVGGPCVNRFVCGSFGVPVFGGGSNITPTPNEPQAVFFLSLR